MHLISRSEPCLIVHKGECVFPTDVPILPIIKLLPIKRGRIESVALSQYMVHLRSLCKTNI